MSLLCSLKSSLYLLFLWQINVEVFFSSVNSAPEAEMSCIAYLLPAAVPFNNKKTIEHFNKKEKSLRSWIFWRLTNALCINDCKDKNIET